MIDKSKLLALSFADSSFGEATLSDCDDVCFLNRSKPLALASPGELTTPLLSRLSYRREENSYWPGFGRIFSQWSKDFFFKQFLPSPLIAAVGFFVGERLLGAFFGQRAMATSCLWALYSINFVGLVIGSVENQMQWKQKIENALSELEQPNSSLQESEKANLEISEARSEMAKNDLRWGMTLPLIGLVCSVIDRKSFLEYGTFTFCRNFIPRFKEAIGAFSNPLGLFIGISSAVSLYELSRFWFETYVGLREESTTNKIYSALTTFALSVPLFARASLEMKAGSLISGKLSFENFQRFKACNFKMARLALKSRFVALPILALAATCGIAIGLSEGVSCFTGASFFQDGVDILRFKRDRMKHQIIK